MLGFVVLTSSFCLPLVTSIMIVLLESLECCSQVSGSSDYWDVTP